MKFAGSCFLIFSAAAVWAVAQEDGVQLSGTPIVTVGMSGTIQQIVLPGTELVPKKVDPRATPIAIRIDNVFPHGDRYRYDLTWFGLEPGEHNLVDYLERKDGSSTADIPVIQVQVDSVLPPDRLKPNEVSEGLLASLGGYQAALFAAGVIWLAGLILILNLGRKKDADLSVDGSRTEVTELDRIQQLLMTALESGELSAEDKAALDTGIFNFWREQRSLTLESMESAIAKLRRDEEAGPLLQGIERWFYSTTPPTSSEIPQLLAPMKRALEAKDVAGSDGVAGEAEAASVAEEAS